MIMSITALMTEKTHANSTQGTHLSHKLTNTKSNNTKQLKPTVNTRMRGEEEYTLYVSHYQIEIKSMFIVP